MKVKNFLYNKILPIILFFLLLIFTFTSSVFANATYENEEYFYYPEGVVPSNMTSDAGKYNCDKVLLKINDIYYMMFFCSSTYSHGTNKLYITSNGRIAGSKIADGELITVRKYNFDTQKWSYYSYGGGNYYEYSSNGVTRLLANNYDIISSSTNIYTNNSFTEVFFDSSVVRYTYSIELSTNDYTSSPVVAYSNYFNYSDAKKYECYISTDAENWTLMNYETYNDTVNNVIKFRFNYKIFENGCYYFKFLNTETNEDYYLSYNISNIIKNPSNSGSSSSSSSIVPQVFCTYERVNNEFIIKTQSFTLSDMQKYQAFYTKEPGDDYSSWYKMSMGSFNNTLTGETEYYFFFTVPADSEDCIYYFVLYDYNLQEYGSPSSMNCSFDKMNEYADSLSPTVSEKNSKFTELLNYFKDRFGFLTYPFEFLIDFFNRILTINYSEPILHIPELREPFGNNIIFNGCDFNFNSLLENTTFSYLYNIYLIAVDFILIVLFIFLCKKVIEEVFGNG